MIKNLRDKFYQLWLNAITIQSKKNNKPLLENARKFVARISFIVAGLMLFVLFLGLPFTIATSFLLSVWAATYFYQRLLKEHQNKDKK